jgi:DsbC/DsbD-like thiol-disulfide interchange protein
MKTQVKVAALFFALSSIALLASSAQDQFVSQQPADAVQVAAGESAQATLHFRVADGYHINSHKPNSDALIPTEVKLDLPADLALANFSYPAGSELRLSFDPSSKLNVYTGDFAVRATIRVPASAAAGERRVRGELDYQACTDRACYPPKKLPISFDVVITKPQS